VKYNNKCKQINPVYRRIPQNSEPYSYRLGSLAMLYWLGNENDRVDIPFKGRPYLAVELE